jgi:hypothetical protein
VLSGAFLWAEPCTHIKKALIQTMCSKSDVDRLGSVAQFEGWKSDSDFRELHHLLVLWLLLLEKRSSVTKIGDLMMMFLRRMTMNSKTKVNQRRIWFSHFKACFCHLIGAF